MPKILCCLCSRRTDTSKKRVRVGTNSNWEMLGIHAEKNGLNMDSFSKQDFVCTKCHAIIAHHGMKDRGPNKTVKVAVPITYEQGIKKNSLRSHSKSSEADVASNQNTPSASVASTDVIVSSDVSKKSHKPKPLVSDPPHELLSCPAPPEESSKSVNETFVVDNEVIPAAILVEKTTAEESETVNSQTPSTEDCLSDAILAVSSTVAKESQKAKQLIRNSFSLAVSRQLISSHEHSGTCFTCANEVVSVVDNEVIANHDHKPTGEPSSVIAATRPKQTMISCEHDSPSSTVNTTTEPNEVICMPDPSIPTSLPEPLITTPSSMATNTLDVKGVKATQSRCFVCQSKGGRKAVPWPAIRQSWFELRCYIPKANRTCDEHLTHSHTFNRDALQMIKALKQYISVEIKEFQLWLDAVSNVPKSTPYNFDVDGIDPEKYKMFLGIDSDSFNDLLQYLKGMRNTSTRSLRNALAMFLLLLRNNMKQEVIAYNFSTTQQSVSKTIDAVSLALEEHFVPKHLGYYHITREEALEKHSIQLMSKVLGQPVSQLCLVADGTYNYIEKPSDFELQRKTFSMHKKRNLLKPLYIVLADGYILEAAGPYFCDSKNNDAANIRHHYKNSDLLLFLEEEDYFLLDRGYRDVVDEIVEKDFCVFMPSLLTGKRANFTCEEANSSRLVTMFRWVIESVNGRIKNVFPFFKHTIEGTYVPKIMRFNRIACAIMNAYFPPLVYNKEFHDVIADVCASDIPNSNELKDEIEKLGLKRMTTRWERASATSAVDFPKLSMDDLKRITLGSYQIKIAERYIETHLKEDADFGIFIHREMEGVIRARIQSRFSKSKTHDAWVKFKQNESGYEAIKGMYCTCKVGERTFGCCSHLTSVLRYLGFDRYQPLKVKIRSRYGWDAIDCDDLSENEVEDDA